MIKKMDLETLYAELLSRYPNPNPYRVRSMSPTEDQIKYSAMLEAVNYIEENREALIASMAPPLNVILGRNDDGRYVAEIADTEGYGTAILPFPECNDLDYLKDLINKFTESLSLRVKFIDDFD